MRRIRVHIVAACAMGALAAQSAAPASAQDAGSLEQPASGHGRKELERAVGAFLRRWREAWQVSEHERHPMTTVAHIRVGAPTETRLRRLHCHPNFRASFMPVVLTSARGLRLCPGYLPSGETMPEDERLGVDAGLAPSQRPGIRAARAALLARLDAAAGSDSPAAAWLAGQRVRFRIDQGDSAGARSAARACRSAQWWCASLLAYVEYYQGDLVAADSTFQLADRHMSAEERCWWADVRVLLEDWRDRERFGASGCERREAEARRFWWLADPLFSEPGNERWVEQRARQMLVRLRGAVPADDRFNWEPRYGGDAVAEMVLRYGWPSYFFWAGPVHDRGHQEWALSRKPNWGVASRSIYWAAEYGDGRLRLTPTHEQLRNPFRIASWDTPIRAPAENPSSWWPREHYAPSAPLAELAGVQVALLRREGGTLVLAATDPGETAEQTLLIPPGDSVQAALVRTGGPDDVEVIARHRQLADSRVLLEGTITATEEALIAVELLPIYQRTTARAPRRRTRFGLALPPPLAEFPRTERAVSTPVMLAVPAFEAPLGVGLDEQLDAARRRMLGTTHLQERPRVGLYWESYGFGPSDTLEVSLRVTHAHDGVLARLGAALRIPGVNMQGDDAGTLSWQELPRRRPEAADTVAGRVPIRSWLQTLDIQALPPGEYRLEVVVANRGGRSARAERTFTVHEPRRR